jgi:hypothetical protein
MVTVITDCLQDIPRIDGTGKRLNDNLVCLNTLNFIFKIQDCLYLIYFNMFSRYILTLFLFPPTDGTQKETPTAEKKPATN